MTREGLHLIACLTVLTPSVVLGDRADLQGNWLQLNGERPEVRLTAAGEAALAGYVPLRDDPDLQCRPASLTNVIGIPDPPFEIRLGGDHVEMNFEYMDVRRRVPLDSQLRAEDAPFTAADYPGLGRSVGHFEGDSLIIETVDPQEKFVDTLRRAYPQSTRMRTEERFTAEGDRLNVAITHTDPVNYREPYVVRFEFIRVDFEILEFGCVIESAGYDDRF